MTKKKRLKTLLFSCLGISAIGTIAIVSTSCDCSNVEGVKKCYIDNIKINDLYTTYCDLEFYFFVEFAQNIKSISGGPSYSFSWVVSMCEAKKYYKGSIKYDESKLVQLEGNVVCIFTDDSTCTFNYAGAINPLTSKLIKWEIKPIF